jgi:Ca2+-binding RTX toxin-like protein
MDHDARKPARSHRVAWLAALVTSGVLLAAAPASAGVTWTYPSVSCSSTLQACIDGANPGDVVELATNTPIPETAFAYRDLTLRAAAGFDPTLLGVDVESPNDPIHVTIRDLHMERILGSFTADPGSSLTARHVDADSPDSPAAELFASVASTFVIEDSDLSTGGHQTEALALGTNHSSGLVTLRAVGNRISTHGNADSGGGIDLTFDGAGRARTDVYNNLIRDAARCNCGGASGILVDPSGTGDEDVNLVGNTVDLVRSSGIFVDDEALPGGHLSLDAFDNVISHVDDSAISIQSLDRSTRTVRLGSNDEFATGRADFLEGVAPGSRNLKRNPRYVDESSGDLRLTAHSPLIDRGIVCSPGGVANLDAAGKGRLAGESVDVGAYERGARLPTGTSIVGRPGRDALKGTSGADIICGMRGRDRLRGRGGGDYVDAGKGQDRLFGGPGNDCLRSRDGVPGNDRVVGGSGRDGYSVDPHDVVLRVERRGCR